MEVKPYISVQTSPAGLPPGGTVTGTVQKSLGSNVYQVQVQGATLEMEIPMELKPGDQIQMRVREATAQKLILDVPLPVKPGGTLAPSDITALLQNLGLPSSKERIQLTQQFLRLNAPMEATTIEASLRAIEGMKSPIRFEAAAFLAAHGIEPDPALVSRMIQLAEPSTPNPVPSPEALSHPILKAYAKYIHSGKEGEIRLPLPPPPSHEELIRILDRSPRLRFLDRAIQLLDKAASTPDIGNPARKVADLLNLVRSFVQSPTENADEVLKQFQSLLRLPGRGIREVRQKVAELEQKILSETAAVREARQWSGPVMDSLDRIVSGKMATQLAALRDDGVSILELPVTHQGKVFTIPIRIIRKKQKGKKANPGGFHIQINTELSKLGEVNTKIDTSGKGLAVRFQVQDEESQKALRKEQQKLDDALQALGWKTSLAIEVGKASPPPFFELFEGDSDYLGVDMRA